MIAIDWDSAPEWAIDVRVNNGGKLVFTNGHCSQKDLIGNGWCEFYPVKNYQIISERPYQQQWPTEDRIDVIGTNGATGEHYTKSATDYLSQGMQILTERGKQYGSNSRECSFPQVAEAFNAITGNELSGSDVCMILAILKLVRQSAQPNRLHEDSLVDGVNYMALYAEMVGKELTGRSC